MKSLQIERSQLNVEALDAQIRSTLGSAFAGLSTQRGVVILQFTEEASGAQMQAARDVAMAHDATVLSANQLLEEARRQAIVDARNQYTQVLDVSAFDAEPTLIQQLAERLAWLEQEIRDLRDL